MRAEDWAFRIVSRDAGPWQTVLCRRADGDPGRDVGHATVPSSSAGCPRVIDEVGSPALPVISAPDAGLCRPSPSFSTRAPNRRFWGCWLLQVVEAQGLSAREGLWWRPWSLASLIEVPTLRGHVPALQSPSEGRQGARLLERGGESAPRRRSGRAAPVALPGRDQCESARSVAQDDRGPGRGQASSGFAVRGRLAAG